MKGSVLYFYEFIACFAISQMQCNHLKAGSSVVIKTVLVKVT
jgi:hypothetical protein